MANVLKDPFLIRLEEQEKKFSPKRPYKEEPEEDENEFEQREKVGRFSTQPDIGFKITAPLMTVVDSRSPFERPEPIPLPTPTERKPTYEMPSIYAPAPKSDQIPSDRSARNIAYLCAKIAEELRKRPQTRDELSLSTGFARQRICTVISVFRAIGLVNVKDSNTRRSEIEWNEQQAKLLPSISGYVHRMLELRQKNRELKEKEELLLQKLKNKNSFHHSFENRPIEGL